MKAVFITSTFDHYHLPSCEEAYKQLGSDFTFISTVPMPDSMKKLGFTDFSKICPYALNAWESEENMQKAKELCDNADMVIIGAASESFVEKRLKENKLTFCFSERLFKKGIKSLFKPKNAIGLYKRHTKFRNNSNYYILCSGYYAPKDFQIIGIKPEKLLRWGYFSAVKELTREFNNDVVTLLWTGRFVELKHPEFALEAAKILQQENINFRMNFIGMGPMQEQMQNYIDSNNLNENVKILGSMPTEEVQKHMDNADIALFTSDRREGWGAVVNEAMVGGCAVVASDAAGSSKSLIENGVNGFVYHHPNKQEFFEYVLALAKDKELRQKIGINANKTLLEKWNGTEGMKRLLDLSRAIIEKKELPEYKDGPCSVAKG